MSRGLPGDTTAATPDAVGHLESGLPGGDVDISPPPVLRIRANCPGMQAWSTPISRRLRSARASRPCLLEQTLRCGRSGWCSNVCPAFRFRADYRTLAQPPPVAAPQQRTHIWAPRSPFHGCRTFSRIERPEQGAALYGSPRRSFQPDAGGSLLSGVRWPGWAISSTSSSSISDTRRVGRPRA